MSVGRADNSDSAPSPGPDRRSVRSNVTEVLAGAGQAFVLMATFLLGLGWGGPTYLAALAQAAVAFVPLLWLAHRRRLGLALLVPVVSAALTAGLLMAGDSLGQTGA